MIQSVLVVLRRLANTRACATTAGTLKAAKGASPFTDNLPDHLKAVDAPDTFKHIVSRPKAPPNPACTKPSIDPSLDKDLRPRIAALFGPSRRVPLKPTQPPSTP